MSTHKYIDQICVAGILLALVITVLFMNGEALGIEKVADEDAEGYAATEYFTSNDLNSASIDFSDSVTITLSEDSASVSGSGAYVYDNEVRIVRSGYYSISGTTDAYRIVVDAEDYSKVWLVFNGVDITCRDDACLQVENAEKVFLVLAEGSVNTLTSGETYSEEAAEAGHNGTIYAKDDLTVTGSGSLTVNAAYMHGIKANDDLVFTGGTVTVTANGDGLHANNSIRLREVSLTIDAQDEGIQTDETDSYIYMESGTVAVTSADDAVKSAGDITIDGGSLELSAGDDAVHSDTAVYINNGTININECYEGIEAKIIEMAGGDVTIYPKDDGLNANGGAASMMAMGPQMGLQPAQEETQTEAAAEPAQPAEDTETGEEETYVLISGGKLTIVNETAQDADGIDSNGDVYITGGDVRVSLVNNGTNNAIDYASENGGVAVINGGTVVASASSNMAESFDSSSEQVSIMYNISSGMDAGTVVVLKDTEGNVLLTETIPCSFSSVTLSTPKLCVGETYILSLNEQEETITVEEVSASYGDAQSGMMGGGMNFGGMMHGETAEDGQMPDFSNTENQTGNQMMGQRGDKPQGERPEGMMPNFRPGMEQPSENTTEGTSQTAPEFQQPPAVNESETGEVSETDNGSETAEGLPQGGPEMSQNSENTAEGTSETGSETEQRIAEGMPNGQMDQNHPMMDEQEGEADNEAVTATEETVSETTKWTMLGVSSLVLIAGFLIISVLKGKSIFS